MSEMLFSLNTTMPLFLCCVAGYLMRRRSLVGGAFVSDCSNVVFHVAIPCNIFYCIATSSFQDIFDWKLVVFLFSACFIIAIASLIICKRLIADQRIAATVAHSIFRSNFTLLGIPLAVSLMGQDGAAPMMLLVPFGILFSNILSAVMLPGSSQSQDSGMAGRLKSVGSIIKNPMTIAAVLGILVSWLELPVPQIAMGTISSFSQMCSGLALFMLGAQLELSSVRKNLKYSAVTILFRLIVIPCAVVFTAVLVGITGNSLAAIFIFFASPTAVTSYVLAYSMGGDGKLAGDAVLTTTCVSAVTLSIGIYIIKALQLI